MIMFICIKQHVTNNEAELKKGVASKKKYVGIFVLKTAQNLE